MLHITTLNHQISFNEVSFISGQTSPEAIRDNTAGSVLAGGQVTRGK